MSIISVAEGLSVNAAVRSLGINRMDIIVSVED